MILSGFWFLSLLRGLQLRQRCHHLPTLGAFLFLYVNWGVPNIMVDELPTGSYKELNVYVVPRYNYVAMRPLLAASLPECCRRQSFSSIKSIQRFQVGQYPGFHQTLTSKNEQ
jgi:hypothetical protein